MSPKTGPVLSKVNSVEDLRKLSPQELPQLCNDLRDFIIEIVSTRPGHLGASLGTVELSVALHYIFNTPDDKLIWDVGHQSYAHKILTGRRDVFHTYRTYKGISGFPRRDESEFDAFGTGHSSTSISAALGMAIASAMKGENQRQHIAVIGDGAMGSGMAFEAMNHAGVSKTNLLVILNDNGIAIDKNVGALKEYLTNITASRAYNRLKVNVWNIIKGSHVRRFINKILVTTKIAIFKQSNLFESLNFRYFGPVDGHDIPRLLKILNDLKDIPGPKLLHCITVKGKGFQVAEKEQTKFHSPGIFDKVTGEIMENTKGDCLPKYQVVFGKTLVELAEANPLITGITPAMLSGCSMGIMAERFPERTFDVGIAEQHAVTFSAGLAVQGMLPYCNIYSTFLQRAYDQIIHDVALQKLHVVFCIDRGGLVGEDGATHHGAFDLSYLRSIPNLVVASPMNESELRNLLYSAQFHNGPYAIRYPKATANSVDCFRPFEMLQPGTGRLIRQGKEIALLTIGYAGMFAAEACRTLEAEGLSVAHYDLRFLKPIDEKMLHEIFQNFSKIITVEDGVITGGMGSAVLEFMAAHNYHTAVHRLGIPDRFVEQGSQAELYRECGYDASGIIAEVKKILTGVPAEKQAL